MTNSGFNFALDLGDRLQVIKAPRHRKPEMPLLLTKGAIYASGFRYCSGCEVFVKTGERRCPDCNRILRSKPRFSRSRKKHYH